MSNTSIIILTAGCLDYLRRCIESIYNYTTNMEIIVVMNGGYFDTKKYLDELGLSDISTISIDVNVGFPIACNIGAKTARSEYLCFLNDDTIVTPGWLDNMLPYLMNEDCGIVGPTTCYSRGLQCDNKLISKRFRMTQEEILSYAKELLPGAEETELYGFCMLMKKSVFDEVGGFYEGYGLGSFEDNDLQLKLRKLGYKGYWIKDSYVHHYGHITYESLGINIDGLIRENKKIFDRRTLEVNNQGS